MKIFITGTDTNIGKTLVSSWLCLHSGYDYFKPIQTGVNLSDPSSISDSNIVAELSSTTNIYQEIYCFKEPVAPDYAAFLDNQEINMNNIILPDSKNLIIEGAGGVMVPINKTALMIDLIKKIATPVILIVSSRLGTINHTLLTLEALRARNIEVLGIIVSGKQNKYNLLAISKYGKVPILAELPLLDQVTNKALKQISLPKKLKALLGCTARFLKL